MNIFSLSPYYKMKLQKFLPKTKNLIVLFVAIFIYGVYKIRNMKTNGSIKEPYDYEPVTAYFKTLPLSDFLTKTELHNHKYKETIPAPLKKYQKLMDKYQAIVKRLINPTWQTVRKPKSHLDVASEINHGRKKRAERQKMHRKLKLIPMTNTTIDKAVLLVTRKRKQTTKKRFTKNIKKWKPKHYIKAKFHGEKKNQQKIAKTKANLVSKRNLNSEKTHKHEKTKLMVIEPSKRNLREADLADIRVTKRICPMKQPHKVDIQMLSMVEKLDFTPYNGNNVYKSQWNEPFSANKPTQGRSLRHKLKVFLVPHSHCDAGWLKTIDSYYNDEVHSILKNMVKKLSANPMWKFIWAEINFLAKWWDSNATKDEKEALKKLLANGQIEIVTGGWVMNDEACGHWVADAAQLTTGQQWVLRTLGYRPRAAWAVDPFGHSPAQVLLLRRAGLSRALLHRVHYRLKKELATHRQLEFRWRQLWDGTGETDILTHVMAFNGYDTPNTCGPDRGVCCQFDFRRISCPSFVSHMRNMTAGQIELSLSRASLTLVDQWRKKADLFRGNVIMVPLGDDFAYRRLSEWDTQFKAYEMFMGYINGYKEFNIEVKFGTLNDYFNAVEEELDPKLFPLLSGDFFPYADKWQSYWSGYFATRPFYKSLDRVLLAYVKAAEIITAIATTQLAVTPAMSARLSERVERTRRGLAMFQHHDAITGTSRHYVMLDYGKRLLSAIQESQSVIKQAAYFLLGQPPTAQTRMTRSSFKNVQNIYFDIDDVWRNPTTLPTRLTMSLTTHSPLRRVIAYNALAFQRTEIITVQVNTHDVQVFNEHHLRVEVQVAPVVVPTNYRLRFTQHLYQLSFSITVGPLSLATYTVILSRAGQPSKPPTYTLVQTYSFESTNLNEEVFKLEESINSPAKDLVLNADDSFQVVVTPLGLLKAIVDKKTSTSIDVEMSFVQYTSKSWQQSNSGAYLFIPPGPAEPVQLETLNPDIVVTRGPHVTTAYVALVARRTAQIFLAISVSNNPSLTQREVEISCTLLLDKAAGDLELAMRLTTSIDSKNVFFTDLNGMQMIKRRYFEKLAIQGNWYPLGGAAYIQDDHHRLTLLSSVPLGVSSLEAGQIEVMLDRRLTRDDGRGLSEAVMDNLRTKYTFKLIHERSNYICKKGVPNNELYGQLTLGAHVSQQMLLQPLVLLHFSPPPKSPVPHFVSNAVMAAADIVVASFRTDVVAMMSNGTLVHGMGLTLQRVHLDDCYGNRTDVGQSYPVGDGQVKVKQIANISSEQVFESTLTFTTVGHKVHDATLFLCPMDITSVFIMQ